MTTMAPPMKSAVPIPVWPMPHRFTVAEYERMGELGLIPEKTELIRGEVIDKMPQGETSQPMRRSAEPTLDRTVSIADDRAGAVTGCVGR